MSIGSRGYLCQLSNTTFTLRGLREGKFVSLQCLPTNTTACFQNICCTAAFLTSHFNYTVSTSQFPSSLSSTTCLGTGSGLLFRRVRSDVPVIVVKTHGNKSSNLWYCGYWDHDSPSTYRELLLMRVVTGFFIMQPDGLASTRDSVLLTFTNPSIFFASPQRQPFTLSRQRYRPARATSWQHNSLSHLVPSTSYYIHHRSSRKRFWGFRLAFTFSSVNRRCRNLGTWNNRSASNTVAGDTPAFRIFSMLSTMR